MSSGFGYYCGKRICTSIARASVSALVKCFGLDCCACRFDAWRFCPQQQQQQHAVEHQAADRMRLPPPLRLRRRNVQKGATRSRAPRSDGYMVTRMCAVTALRHRGPNTARSRRDSSGGAVSASHMVWSKHMSLRARLYGRAFG